MKDYLFGVLLVLVALALGICCSRVPPIVFPVASGGALGFGGQLVSDSGVTGVAGTVGFGGASPVTTTAAPVAFDWPECAPKSAKLDSRNVARYRRTLMPKRERQMTRRARASYVVVEVPERRLTWAPLAPTLNQIDGSCTGNSAIQSVVSLPWTWSGTLDPVALERLALDVYSDATQIDPFAGTYPPDDTGSDGESVMRVLQRRGLVSSYLGGYTFEGLQRSGQSGPCIVGTNWYTGMFSPDRCGQIAPTGIVEGAHEWKVDGWDFDRKLVRGLNSWGDEFGARVNGQGGFFVLTFGTLAKLLDDGGDFHCPKVE